MLLKTFSVLLCAYALSSSRGTGVVEESVDLIEMNHFFDHRGLHVYDQVIFYERAADTGRYQVRAWCLVEDREALHRRPIQNQQTQLYQVDWYDNDQKLMRRITSRMYRESWTQIDPERADKKLHDERSRILLVQNPKKLFADRPARSLAGKQPCNDTATTNIAATPTPATTNPIQDSVVRR